MRKQYHWSIKVIAFLLVFASGAGLAMCGLSVVYNVNRDMYRAETLQEKQNQLIEERLLNYSYETALYLGHEYLQQQRTGTDTQEKAVWREAISYFWGYTDSLLERADYVITDESGKVLAKNDQVDADYVMTIPQEVALNDGIVVSLGSSIANMEYPSFNELTPNYEWKDWKGDPLPGLDSRTVNYEFFNDGSTLYRVERFADMIVTVELKLTQEDMADIAAETYELRLMSATWAMKEFDIPVSIVCAVTLLGAVIYLCFAAGKKPGTMEIQPRGLNRMPLDLFFCLVTGLVLGVGALGISAMAVMSDAQQIEGVWLLIYCIGLCGGVIVLSVTCFLTALCAQARLGGWYWLKKTVIGRCWKGCWNLIKKIWFGFWNLVAKLWGKIWGKAQSSNLTGKAVNAIPKFGHMLVGTYKNIHLCWQWVLLYSALFALMICAGITFRSHQGMAFVVIALFGFPIVLYTSYGFGKLRDAAKRMSEGDLDTKIDTYEEFLYGNFAEFAGDLNALGDTCVDAALEKMKSERMKSELITNVSHDIKTPLTSIINYVDLLQKTDSEEERREYLEVLDRQSQRLKKLIEDLMEMSKASSGNVVVELAENDIIEAVNQALGEFADRMENLNLSVIFRQSHQSIYAKFDGKLLWRVMSNILSNVVKYALPGTRVYVDVDVTDSKVLLSVKNISRESLNISAEELMERFVRGDESRNSEGNGLGLNIAKSLMEVQGGDLALTVDGDLFKVILILN